MAIRITGRTRGRPSAGQKALTDFAQEVGIDMQSAQIEATPYEFDDTGNAYKSYQVEVQAPNKVTLSFARYLMTSIKGIGREPGKGVPYKPELGLNNILQKWVKRKGLATKESEINSIAYLINRKMKNEGNAVYRGDREGIDLAEIINAAFDKRGDDIGQDMAEVTAENIKKYFEGKGFKTSLRIN